MSMQSDSAGRAALSICEALLLALGDRGVFTAREITGLLDDAAERHENETGSEAEMAEHRQAAELIRAIIASEPPVGRG